MENKTATKLFIQIPDCIIRNETAKMDSNTFAVYTYLSFLHFRNNKEDKIKSFDHNSFKHKLYITDNRTLKKCLITLHKQGYVLENIDKFPSKGTMEITFQPMPVDILTFTQIPASILNRIDKIGTIGLRLLIYYESYINRQDPLSKQFAYPSIETTAKLLKINEDTITKYNDILVKEKLLKITKHKLEYADELNELDEPIRFTKYHNHYDVQIRKL